MSNVLKEVIFFGYYVFHFYIVLKFSSKSKKHSFFKLVCFF